MYIYTEASPLIDTVPLTDTHTHIPCSYITAIESETRYSHTTVPSSWTIPAVIKFVFLYIGHSIIVYLQCVDAVSHLF